VVGATSSEGFLVIIMPHRSTTWSVGLSVGLSVTLVSHAETDEPIEMPFGLRTPFGPY